MKSHSKWYALFLGFFILISLPKNLLTLAPAHRKAFRLACEDALIRGRFGWKNPNAFLA
jgi:hypothetical protein